MRLLYSVELFRIIFILLITLGHILSIFPALSDSYSELLHIKYRCLWFGVECFFIIGGFFLYKKLSTNEPLFPKIQKLYTRLIKPYLFYIFLAIVFGVVNISKLPMVFTLTQGISVNGEVIGWGDWYIGAYFWSCVFYLCLFSCFKKQQALFFTLIIMYICFCAKANIHCQQFLFAYGGILGEGMLRGLCNIGLGILSAFLSEQISFFKTTSVDYVLNTIIEILCIYTLFKFMLVGSSHTAYFDAQLIFALLILMLKKSDGLISKFLNSQTYLCSISKYVYPFLISQGLTIILFLKYKEKCEILNLINNDSLYAIFIILTAIFLAIVELQIFEKKILPFFNKSKN